MGNHLVGKFFHVGISILSDEEIENLTQEKALNILCDIGDEVVKITSLDAEFDDYDNPNQRLGRVLIKAYLPEKYDEWKNLEYVDEKIDEEWYNKVYEPFKKRFGFW